MLETEVLRSSNQRGMPNDQVVSVKVPGNGRESSHEAGQASKMISGSRVENARTQRSQDDWASVALYLVLASIRVADAIPQSILRTVFSEGPNYFGLSRGTLALPSCLPKQGQISNPRLLRQDRTAPQAATRMQICISTMRIYALEILTAFKEDHISVQLEHEVHDMKGQKQTSKNEKGQKLSLSTNTPIRYLDVRCTPCQSWI